MVAPNIHKRLPNGILGLLCRQHFPGMVAFGGSMEPGYTLEHYVAFLDMPDRDDRVFRNKAERVMVELWISLPHITMVCTSLSKGIRELMIRFAKSIYRTSTDARPDMRARRPLWLTQPVSNS